MWDCSFTTDTTVGFRTLYESKQKLRKSTRQLAGSWRFYSKHGTRRDMARCLLLEVVKLGDWTH